MKNKSINLLQHDRIRAFRRTYFFHLLTILILVGVSVIAVHSILLAPSYVYEQIVISKQQDRLSTLSDRVLSPDEQYADDHMKLLEADPTYLTRLSASSTVSTALRVALAVPRPGITITGITFSAQTTDQKSRLIISGVAASRDALRQYVLAFSRVPGIESAAVPISAYSSETKILFPLTLMGTFLP